MEMEGKSKLPTLLKKPTIRTQVPSDRLVATTNGVNKTSTVAGPKTLAGNRPALTSFQNVLNNLRHGTGTGTNRPTKRHASPEFRPSKNPLDMVKRMRRSRSVSDLQSEFDLAQVRKRAVNQFPALAMTKTALNSKMPSVRVPLAPPKAKQITRPVTATAKSVPIKSVAPKVAAHKKLVLNSAKNENDEPKTLKASTKRIAPYDFKARFHDLNERHKTLKDKYETLREQLGDLEELPGKYEECQQKLSELEAEYRKLQSELGTMKQESVADQLKIKTLNDGLNAKIEECRTLAESKQQITEQYTAVNTENSVLKSDKADMEVKLKSQQEIIEQMTLELQEAAEQLFRANIDRKDLHNTIMDLRGNIRVFCRIRPPLEGEDNRQMCSWQHNDETSLEIASLEPSKKTVKHEFNFDQVFRPNSHQLDIFELVSPLVQSALDGYNVCIFAYGQTGSGKTFTMDGTESMPGIIPRTIDFLFDCFQQNKKLGWEFTLRASSLEIYNEILFDLLTNEAKDLEIRMVCAKKPTEICVSNLTECEVNNKEELHQLIEYAKNNRATASTVGNERSSRSHSVTQLRLYGVHKEKNEMTVSTINLIDLAGSESPKTSVRMEETKKINKSLSELTNVIMALLQKQDHIPYRNSKLTHLLMPSLGGNSKTLMFVNASPFQDCFVETVKSLRFAASVNSCKMNKAKKNKIYPGVTPNNSSVNGKESL